jgi:hypothetical protein
MTKFKSLLVVESIEASLRPFVSNAFTHFFTASSLPSPAFERIA